MKRISIAELCGIIAVCAIGCAAMRSGSFFWVKVCYTVTLGVLFVVLLGAIVGARPRAAWVGFAVFGWGYFVVAFLPGLGSDIETNQTLLTSDLLTGLAGWFHRTPKAPANVDLNKVNLPGGEMTLLSSTDPATHAFAESRFTYGTRMDQSIKAGHLLMCLFLGFVGAILGSILAGRRETEQRSRDDSAHPLLGK